LWDARAAGNLAAMTAGEPRRLGVEVRFDAEPIEGRVYDHDDGRVDRPFSGWLGLMAAIEAAARVRPEASEIRGETR